MSITMPNSTLINKLIQTASEDCTLLFKHAAVLLHNSRPVSKISVNNDRRYCHGKCTPSLHAEATAIVETCGKRIKYSEKHGWCFLREKGKKAQET